MVDDIYSERLKIQLAALTHSPQGHVDDTRFEKLLDRLTPYVIEESKLKIFLDNEGLLSIEKGLSLDDERVVSVALRLVGLLASKLSFPSHSHLPNDHVTKLMASLLDPQFININSDALVRNACLIGLATSLSSPVSVDWVTSYERINRLISFIFRSFSDSSVFIARSATQLLCELLTKGSKVENRLLEAGLKRHIDTSMSEVPKADFHNNIVSPPPLHHNKICLIDLAIALHQHSHSSILDISLSSLLGLLSDSDRHVRSRMVEAIQIIGVNNNNNMEPENNSHSLAILERDIYNITNNLVASGESDFILTAIELVGALSVGFSETYLQKFLDLVIGIIVPAFGKVISIEVEVANIFPVDIPQNILLQSVLECFKNMIANGHTKILPGSLVVELVKYGLAGGASQHSLYVRECRPAFELAALLLSLIPSSSPSSLPSHPIISANDFQSILHTLLVNLARSWSSVSVKTVVSLLGNGKLESKIFIDFGFQLKDSITKGYASDESESREHVVAFIGTLYKEDTSQTAVQYYLASGFYEIVLTALSDSDSAVRTAALESLKYISAEEKTWKHMIALTSDAVVSLVSNFTPANDISNNSSQLSEYPLLQLVVHLLYDEDPYVQRESISVIKSWTVSEHTKLALQYLIWKPTSGLYEGINHALHRSDWDAQVQAIQLLRSIAFSLGLLSFFAIKGNSLVLDMIKNCEERVSQKEAYVTLRDLRGFIDQHNSDPSLLLSISLPLSSPPSVGNINSFQTYLKELILQIRSLEVDKMLQGLSDEHLYDEDEEEDLVLKYQDITSHDDLDCD